MTGFSNSNPPINRSVVHTPQHRCLSPALTHANAQRNKHKCSLFCAAKTKSQSLHGGLFDTPKACTATEASKCVCARSWSSYTADGRNKSHEVSFSRLVSPCWHFGSHEKKMHILCKRPVTATRSVYDFQHPGHQAPCMNAPLLCLYLAVY